MKKMLKMAVAVMMTTSMVTTAGVSAFAAQAVQTSTSIKTIEVNGKGIVTAKPDVATIGFSVETKEKTAEEAQRKNRNITESVTKALKALGVTSEDIVTQYYTVDTDKTYDQQKNTWVEKGYRATNSFTVKVKDVDNVGKYIDAATKAGVTSVGAVSFSLSDPTQYYSQALQAAVKNASASAQTLANALGVSLGDCISVEEISSYQSYTTENAVMPKSAMAADTSAESSSADIRYDDMEISANVVMQYAY